MGVGTINFLAFGAVGDAFRAWCAPYPAKALATQFGVVEATAERWRVGKLPEPRHLVRMVEVWGAPFLSFIFAPAVAQTRDDLLGDLDAIEAHVALIRQRMAHAQQHSADLRAALDAAGVVAGRDGRPARPIAGAAQPGGGAAGTAGATARSRRRRAWETLAVLLMLSAAIHEPIAAALDDAAPWTRLVRTGRAGRRTEA